MERTALESRLFDTIAKEHARCIALSDDLADHPEVSGQERRSSAQIAALLSACGWRVEMPFDGYETGFRAVKGPDTHRKKVALLTEYDALPELGHACGHCVSAGISVLAGLALSELQDELDADIHILGTPAEETDGAKCTMADHGVFDRYDMAMMVHLYNSNMVSARMQALRCYMFTFHGRAAHASAAPWEGRNALNGLQLMGVATDMLRQHLLPECQIHYCIRNGGAAPNIVPEEASMELYMRALHGEVIDDLQSKIFDCARGAALATQTTVDWYECDHAYDCLKENPAGTACLRQVYEDLGIEPNGDETKIFGSSDTGNVSSRCPTFHAMLQIAPADVPIHTREFEAAVRTPLAHDAIALGAKVIGLQTLRMFTDEKLHAEMLRPYAR